MPKDTVTDAASFRRTFLLLFFFYACHIQKATLKIRNLYPNIILIFLSTIALSILIVNVISSIFQKIYLADRNLVGHALFCLRLR